MIARIVRKLHNIYFKENFNIERCTYKQDGLFTYHNSEFKNDSRFNKAYSAGKATGSWGVDIEWRVYLACWAADQAKDLDGDFVECGVNKGGISRAIAEYVSFENLDKKFYLLDTFEGLVEEYLSTAEKEKGFHLNTWGYEDCIDQVKTTFKGYNVEIIKGAIPGTLSQVNTEKVSFLSIDMNCVYPEIEAIKFFWDKVVPGGMILLDDYGWSSHRDQKLAFDEFVSDKRESILSLPTGQGLITKKK